MPNTRFVSSVLILALLAWLPIPAMAADTSAKPAAAPQVNTVPAPLSPAELSRYSQLQTTAQEQGMLAQKGGADETTWLVVGTITIVAVTVGLIVAAKQ